MIATGKLNRRVTIEQRASTRSAAGEEVAAWAAVATVWACIRPLSGFERNRARIAGAETEVEIYCRYRAGITTDMRVTHGGKRYAIHAVIDSDMAHRELQLLCTESLADG